MRVLCLNKFLPDIKNNQLKSSGMYTFEKRGKDSSYLPLSQYKIDFTETSLVFQDSGMSTADYLGN